MDNSLPHYIGISVGSCRVSTPPVGGMYGQAAREGSMGYTPCEVKEKPNAGLGLLEELEGLHPTMGTTATATVTEPAGHSGH